MEKHPTYGMILCAQCRTRQAQLPIAHSQVEFTTDTIKGERKAYATDITQPFRDGHLSQEYLDQYGSKGIITSPEDLKKARYVWNDGEYYKKY